MGPDLNIVSETAENKPNLCFINSTATYLPHISTSKKGGLRIGSLLVHTAPILFVVVSLNQCAYR